MRGRTKWGYFGQHVSFFLVRRVMKREVAPRNQGIARREPRTQGSLNLTMVSRLRGRTDGPELNHGRGLYLRGDGWTGAEGRGRGKEAVTPPHLVRGGRWLRGNREGEGRDPRIASHASVSVLPYLYGPTLSLENAPMSPSLSPGCHLSPQSQPALVNVNNLLSSWVSNKFQIRYLPK